MDTAITLSATNKLARFIGALYLLAAPLHMFTMMVQWQITVPQDAAATAANVLAQAGLLRAAIVSWLVGQAMFIVLPLALYRLFKNVSPTAARLMVFFIIASVPIAYANELNRVAALTIIHSESLGRAFTAAQLQTQVEFYLTLHAHGMMVAHIFWGLWLLPLGYLIIRSRYVPKVLGYLLWLGGLGYLVDFFLYLLLPNSGVTLSQFTFVGEVLLPLWLLVRGVHPRRWQGFQRLSGPVAANGQGT